MFRRSSVVIAAAAACALGAQASAQSFFNGSLEGPTNTFSLVPEGWSNLPQGTSDTVSTAGHPFGGSFGIGAIAFPASDNGGTFVWSADFFQPAAGVPEGIRQTVAGLIVGQEYEITFEFTNLGLYTPQGEIATSAFGGQNYASNGNWVITGNNALLGSTPIVAFSQSAGGQVWQDFSLTFTAAQPIIEFAFIANWTSGGTHVGMGIDGIGIAQVPAPGAMALLGLAAAVAGRRRR